MVAPIGTGGSKQDVTPPSIPGGISHYMKLLDTGLEERLSYTLDGAPVVSLTDNDIGKCRVHLYNCTTRQMTALVVVLTELLIAACGIEPTIQLADFLFDLRAKLHDTNPARKADPFSPASE